MKSRRKGYWHRVAGGGVLLSALCFTLLAFGQTRDTNSSTAAGLPDYDLSRHTVDGGGVTFSSGGNFELSGTVGQPDAGRPMTGDGFELTGGFWFEIAPGDCNTDGGVNLFDYDAFEACLSGPSGGAISPACACFDLDGSGTVDMSDFALLQKGFSGS